MKPITLCGPGKVIKHLQSSFSPLALYLAIHLFKQGGGNNIVWKTQTNIFGNPIHKYTADYGKGYDRDVDNTECLKNNETLATNSK